MAVSKTFKFEITVIVDDDNADLLDTLQRMYDRDTLIALKDFTIDGVRGSIHQHVLRRANVSIPKGWHIDHLDINRWNNIRRNLEPKSPRDNNMNRSNSIEKQSRYYGVTWSKRDRKWYAGIHTGSLYKKTSKRHYCGVFNDEEEAALAVNRKIIELGLDKPLNVIEGKEIINLEERTELKAVGD